METNNTRKTNKNKNTTQKTNYPFNQHNIIKIPELQGKQCFHRLKAQQETRNNNTKHKYQNKTNIETERLKHTPWKQKQEQQKKNKQPKMKTAWVSKRGC